MKSLSRISTLTIAGLIIAAWVESFRPSIPWWFLLAAISTGMLLWHAFFLMRQIGLSETPLNAFLGSAHVAAHIIPLSYFVAAYFGYIAQWVDAVYLPLFLFFYYSGWRLWIMLFTRFKTKLYAFFILGNFGMLTGIPVPFILELGCPERFGAMLFIGMLLGYFAVHFLLTGLTVDLIEKDFQREQLA